MTHASKSLVLEVKESIVTAIEGAGNVSDTLTDVVTAVAVDTLHGTRAVGAEFLALGAGVITGAVHGVTETGSEAGNYARSIMVGVLRGTEAAGKASAETVGAYA